MTNSMQTYIAVLRGINVSGHKMIRMDALTKTFESLGFQKVKTYIQSGNVVFQSSDSDHKILEATISQKIIEDFGFDVPVLVLASQTLNFVFNNNPFLNERKEDLNFLHATFLGGKPDDALMLKINDLKFGTDEFIIANEVVYVFCPNGYGNTKLNNTFFESKLKQTATTRNWKTVTELVRIAELIHHS